MDPNQFPFEELLHREKLRCLTACSHVLLAFIFGIFACADLASIHSLEYRIIVNTNLNL